MISAAQMPPIMAQVPRLRSWVMPYRKPAAYKSPAPVESTTSSTFFGFDKDFDTAVDNDRTFGIAGNGGDFDQRLDQIERFVEVVFGKQGFEFFLIAEKECRHGLLSN